MLRLIESELTISCLQRDLSVETVNTRARVASSFLEAAASHVDEHEQHTSPPQEARERLPNATQEPRPAFWTGIAVSIE